MTIKTLLSVYTAAGGQCTGEELDRAGREAWMLMLGQSRGRIQEVEAETPEGRLVQDCFCALVDGGSGNREGMIASETLGQWSRTYRDDQKSRDRRLLEILREYLGETGLLYRGWPA